MKRKKDGGRTNDQMDRKMARQTDGQAEGSTEELKEKGKQGGQIAVLTCGIYLMSVTPIFIYEK